jgi:multiple sugar transport system permease protein/putative chitobiose transport system permease protein
MRRRTTQIFAHSWLVLLVLVYVIPIWLMIVTSFRSPTGGGVFRDWSPFSFKAFIPYNPDLSGYKTLFAAGSYFPQALVNTLIVCAVTLVVGTIINLLAGFTFSYFEFPGSNVIFTLTLVTFMVPFEAIVIPILSIMQKLNLVDTLAAVILPTVANGFLVFMFRQFYRGIPKDLREAAMLDGAGLGTILLRIYLPLSRPLMVTSGIVLFIAQWQSLFLPLAVLRSPSNWVLQLSLSSLQGTIQLPSWGPVLAAGVITLLIPVILVAPFMRYFKLSLLDGATRG